MPARSRKRGRRTPRAADSAAAAARAARAAAKPETVGAAEAKPSRSEGRDAAVRATLAPYRAGERPWAIRIAVLLAILVGGGNVVDVIVGGHVSLGRSHAGVGGVVLFSVMMLICAGGMWAMRYWAVLGFQAILGIVILIFSLFLIRASNFLGFVVAIVIVFGGGWLFFKLVRVLSRIQMPTPPSRGTRVR